MNESLMKVFQSNPIIASGFRNPKCMAAFELMQKNPKEAQAKFQSDIEVTRFLQEFGRVMSDHFTTLGAQQAQSTAATPSSSSTLPAVEKRGLISEVSDADVSSDRVNKMVEKAAVGPIYVDVMKREKEIKQRYTILIICGIYVCLYDLHTNHHCSCSHFTYVCTA